MSKEFTFADPGEGLEEAEILDVHVSSGDHVADGDTVLTVETDKANTDIPAPFSGTVEEVRVSEGDVVEVGGVLMTYDEDGESGEKGSGAGEEPEESGRKERGEEDETQGKSDEKGARRTEEGEAEETSEQSEATEEEGNRGQPVPASPSTRRVAREKNVDIRNIEPSGEHGRVTTEDVEAAAGEAATGASESGAKERKPKTSRLRGAAALIPGGGEAPALPDFSQWGETERVPLRSIRRATARNMARSWGQIPHVYHQDVADVTELERFRREHEDAAEVEGGKFTLTVLVMKALASALRQFPRFNASLDVDSQEIVLKHYCHIGLAVATDRGLLVPVVRDVDEKNMVELSAETAETADIAQKVRGGDVEREDMQGGSMTVTNPGPMGGSSLTPLINHPQVAILGMARAQYEPVVHGDLDDYVIKPRLHLPLVLGFDHRVNDGADAAKFVTHLIETLADPESLLLNI